MSEKIYKRKEPTAARQKDAQELIESNLIGLRFPGIDKLHPKGFMQNFAVDEDSKLFLHGRDILPPAAAARYFSPGFNKASLPYSAFGQAAKDKVRHFLSPEGLENRMDTYFKSPKKQASVYALIRNLKEKHPGWQPPELPRKITPENADKVRTAVMRSAETQGININEMQHGFSFPPEKDLAEMKDAFQKNVKKQLSACWRSLKEKGRGAFIESFRESLPAYVAEHGNDPQIIYNFMAGIDLTPNARYAPVADIVQNGLELRTQGMVRGAATRLTDPYSSIFTSVEQDIASNLVHSVPPRLLRNAIRDKAAFLVADSDGAQIFNDICPDDKLEGAAGAFVPAWHHKAPGSQSFIIIGAPLHDYYEIGRVARHEVAHHADMTDPDGPYGAKARDDIAGMIDADRKKLLDTQYFLDHLDVKSKQDVQQLLALEKTRDRKSRVGDISTANAETIRTLLKRDVFSILRYADSHFLNPARAYKSYALPHDQRNEIPAVMETFKGEYGAAFIRELMPNLYESTLRHRLQNSGLRGGPDSGAGR